MGNRVIASTLRGRAADRPRRRAIRHDVLKTSGGRLERQRPWTRRNRVTLVDRERGEGLRSEVTAAVQVIVKFRLLRNKVFSGPLVIERGVCFSAANQLVPAAGEVVRQGKRVAPTVDPPERRPQRQQDERLAR